MCQPPKIRLPPNRSATHEKAFPIPPISPSNFVQNDEKIDSNPPLTRTVAIAIPGSWMVGMHGVSHPMTSNSDFSETASTTSTTSIEELSEASVPSSPKKVGFHHVVKVHYTHGSKEYDRKSTPTTGNLSKEDIDEVLEMRRRFFYQQKFLEHQRDSFLALLPSSPATPDSVYSDDTLGDEKQARLDKCTKECVDVALLELQLDAARTLSS
jgi:hypothetical protein